MFYEKKQVGLNLGKLIRGNLLANDIGPEGCVQVSTGRMTSKEEDYLERLREERWGWGGA